MSAVVKSMDIKKAQPSSAEIQQAVSKKRVDSFVTDIKSEITKVHWTSREELVVYARIVVISTFVLGLGIYFTDIIIQTVLVALGSLVRMIAG